MPMRVNWLSLSHALLKPRSLVGVFHSYYAFKFVKHTQILARAVSLNNRFNILDFEVSD